MDIVTHEEMGDRSLTKEYRLTESARKDAFGRTMVPTLQVYTFHSKDRKMIITLISRAMVGGGWKRQTVEIGNGDTCPITSRVGLFVERYSAKALKERHEEMLDQVENLPGPLWQSLLKWASEAKG